MRACLTIVLLAALLAGCAGEPGSRSTPTAAVRIDKCADRLLSRAASGVDRQQARRYAIDTYCGPFERKGWVYDDGALSIAAQNWLDKGGVCATSSTTGRTQTIPCDQVNGGMIDCALLHHVRKAEATAYIATLQKDGAVRCDDGTPLDELGVP
jgi:hypothetical protein